MPSRAAAAALSALVDALLDDWIATADEQAAGGNVFGYANQSSPHRLLHMPLAPEIPNLSKQHARFVAGRSMRDVEPSVALNPRDPQGGMIANADDLHEQERATLEPGRLDLRAGRNDRSSHALGRRRRSRALGDAARLLHHYPRAAPCNTPGAAAQSAGTFAAREKRCRCARRRSARTGRASCRATSSAPVFPAYFVCEQVEIVSVDDKPARRRRLVRWQDLDAARRAAQIHIRSTARNPT